MYGIILQTSVRYVKEKMMISYVTETMSVMDKLGILSDAAKYVAIPIALIYFILPVFR